MNFEWDPAKAAENLRKHGIDFADATGVLFDEHSLTILDEGAHEERFVTIGADTLNRILVVVYTFRGETVRMISARKATTRERRQLEEGP